jgi:hypothetical protein
MGISALNALRKLADGRYRLDVSYGICLSGLWLSVTQNCYDGGKEIAGFGRALSRFTGGKLSAGNIPSRTCRDTHRKMAIIGQFVEQRSVYRAQRSLQWRRFITSRIRRRVWHYPLLSDISQKLESSFSGRFSKLHDCTGRGTSLLLEGGVLVGVGVGVACHAR